MPLKLFIRDIFVIANYITYIRRRNYLGRIVVFHDIRDEKKFREKIIWLRERYKIVKIDQLLHETSEKPRLALTFDDGYRCWYEKAAPILKELGIPATFFVCSGFIGLEGEKLQWFCKNRLKRTQVLKPLTRSQLIELSNDPLFEVGSHTKNHIDLGRYVRYDVLINEIGDDKKQLEDWIGKPIRWFAYPFGRNVNVSHQAKHYIQQAGFKGAFTIIPGFVHPLKDRFFINRDSLDLFSSEMLWSAWLNGAYDRLYDLKERYLLQIFGLLGGQ